uniref:Transporter n=1 Tax=Ascaris lumbricoides TaxID=6252 RepID=A0A0M3IPB0_ASCLU
MALKFGDAGIPFLGYFIDFSYLHTSFINVLLTSVGWSQLEFGLDRDRKRARGDREARRGTACFGTRCCVTFYLKTFLDRYPPNEWCKYVMYFDASSFTFYL